MAKFNVGDRVKVKESRRCVGMGETAKVTSVSDGLLTVEWEPCSSTDLKSGGGWFVSRFELIEDFDVKMATDEELGAKYRELRNQCMPVYDELRFRGYMVSVDGHPITAPTYTGKPIEITKSITTKKEI